jgi:hypothetical protein
MSYGINVAGGIVFPTKQSSKGETLSQQKRQDLVASSRIKGPMQKLIRCMLGCASDADDPLPDFKYQEMDTISGPIS